MYIIKEGEFELTKKVKTDMQGEADMSDFLKKGGSVIQSC